MNNQKPQFGDNCQQCMACVQWCPQKAIDRNGISEKRKHHHNLKAMAGYRTVVPVTEKTNRLHYILRGYLLKQ